MVELCVNSRIRNLKESATLAINQKAKTMRAQGRKIYHFGFGQSPFPVARPIQEALARNTHRKEYLPSLGLMELREQFCRYYEKRYGYRFRPENVLVGPGSKELIFQALFVLEGPFFIPAPSWVSYGPQASIRGKRIHAIRTQMENGYKLTVEELTQACHQFRSDPQKILIINSPNNPSGAVYRADEIRALSEVCRKNGVIVISDEIYALTSFLEEDYVGFSKFYPEGTIVTTGLSKGHSAGGYRLGFLAAPSGMEVVMKCLAALVSETFSAVSAPIQYSALAAYSEDPEVERHVRACTRVHRAAGMYLHSRLEAMGAPCPKPDGGFYLFPDFEKFRSAFSKMGVTNAAQMCQRFLDELGIAALPADDFYFPENVLACRMATVDYDGEKVLEAALRESGELDDRFIEENCPNLVEGSDALSVFLKSLKNVKAAGAETEPKPKRSAPSRVFSDL